MEKIPSQPWLRIAWSPFARTQMSPFENDTIKRVIKLAFVAEENYRFISFRRGSQVVRQGSAKASSVGSIPTSASKFIAFIYKGLVV